MAVFGAVSAAYFLWGHAARDQHHHYSDGTFVLGLHFLPVILRSALRMMWIWGLAAIGILLWLRLAKRIVPIGLGWMAIALLPYCFLTYMPFVPSRHTYLASAGLAFLAGAAIVALRDRFRGREPLVVLPLLIVFSIEVLYLWAYKHPQYVRRVLPTEQVFALADDHEGEVIIECAPYGSSVFEAALQARYGDRVQFALGRRFSRDPLARVITFCTPDGSARLMDD